MLDWIQALSPVLSALIGVFSYATLTNYRLDKLDSQVEKIEMLKKDINGLDKNVIPFSNKLFFVVAFFIEINCKIMIVIFY